MRFAVPEMFSFIQFRWLDLLDILVVSFVVYRLFLLMKGTRAIQMFVGLVVLLLVAFLAQLWQMEGVTWIVGSFKALWIVAFVIVFQPEIRGALAQLGRNRWVGPFLRSRSRVLDEVMQAVEGMMKRGIGAIIAFERDTGLKSYIDTGTKIEASVTAELLNTIFTPLTPLHDGAVIIRGETIAAAGCVLPLSQDQSLPHALGMRHRAALGLVEESDAVAVVVSETSKHVCLASDQKLYHDLPLAELRAQLAVLLHIKA